MESGLRVPQLNAASNWPPGSLCDYRSESLRDSSVRDLTPSLL
jgi:hypothetical protein